MKSKWRKFGRALIFAVLFATMAFVSVGCASAATHYVNPGESIQAAVDAAGPGDTIIVRDGTYTENVDVKKSLTPALAQGPTVTEFPICIDPAGQEHPAISGDIVVWEDWRNGGGADIYGYDLSTNTEFPISTNPAHSTDVAVSGDTVVWVDYRNGNWDIYGYDLSTGDEFPICTDPALQCLPAISGDIVVWMDNRNGNHDIYSYDLSTGDEFPICTDPANQEHPAISGDIVVWRDSRNGNYDIYGYDLSTGDEFPICTEPAHQVNPAISQDIVVWEVWGNGNGDIYGYDLSTDNEFPICTNPATQWLPAVSGNIVVWWDYRNGDPAEFTNPDIYGYDLSTDTEFPICTDPANQEWVAISGDIVVWEDTRSAYPNIYGARLGLAQLKVCIDPGHGGTDGGAPGYDGPAYPNEKDFTLDIALRLRDLLESEGIEVVMTREEDVDIDLQTRCDIANDNSCDIFVSIHCNSGVPIAHGTETFYYDHLDIPNPEVDQAGYGLAYNIQKELVAEIGLTDRRTEGDFAYYGYHLYVLSHTDMPAALTEVAFISNPTEFNLLSNPSFRQRAAQGIANGILRYFEESALTITAYSPVDIVVTDPDGLTISKQLNEIPGATYTEVDINGDGDPDDKIIIPYRKIGNYLISVVPEPDALPTDTYTLEVSVEDTTITLAEDVQISDIRDWPYMIRSTEGGIIQIIPAMIDFDPDTLNLQSKGKWVTTYIELPEGYDVSAINVSTVMLNDQVQAELHPTEIGDYDFDGIPDLMVKFDRQAVIAMPIVGDAVNVTVTGKLYDGTSFEGCDVIRVIDEGKGK